ncbi:MAG: TolC family protein, partial [Candidatus Obscuribacterales bacterium]|nr:TolC family protein [Candidatus Obscuribacterales bacterium]
MISVWKFSTALALVSTQVFISAQAESENYLKPGSNGVRIFKPIPLPEEAPLDHNADKVLSMGPLRQYNLPSLAATKPIRLEATFNEALSLKDALETALKYSLPIKISRESLRYQEYQLAGEIAGYLPSFSTSWGITNTQVGPITTQANSRLFQATVRYPVFTGGNAFYTALSQYYRSKAWQETQKGTVNDTLLDVYFKYSNLVLNDALLQIKAKSLAISESQLKLNNALFQSGTGTQFAIMQSRAQLAADQQAFLQQQMLTRQSAMALAFALDIPMAVNLIPQEGDLVENTIVDERLQIAELLNASLSHRPDIKQYELLRLAACRNMQVASASLYPTISFFTTF